MPAGAGPDTVISKQDFTFYQANTTYAGCNLNNGGAGRLTLDEANQTLSPVTQVCRVYPQGNDTKSTESSVRPMTRTSRISTPVCMRSWPPTTSGATISR